ncbi:MAG: disulfide bond formation protein B [Gammaproteobacteria bacterium]
MQKTTYKKFQNFMLFVSLFVVGFAFYIEFVNQLKPCPLCVMQRACAFLFGFSCVLGVVVASLRRAKFLSLAQCILTGLGLYFASRQLWLQSLPPDDMGQCMPGLEAMLQYFSWDMILKSFVWGTSDCSSVDWQWYGLSIPLWSALYFGFMFVINLYVYIQVFLSQKYHKKF